METLTSEEVFRFGKEWMEHNAARCLAWYAKTGGYHWIKFQSIHFTPFKAWKNLTGKDFQYQGMNYSITPELKKEFILWVMRATPPNKIQYIHPHSIWYWLQHFTPKQQQRILEILYQRYPL